MAIIKSVEIAGAGSYPSEKLNQRERKVLAVSDSFVPAVPGNWNPSAPSSVDAALNQLASGNGIAATVSAVYDFSVNGGAGSPSLSVSIPANAIVVEVIRDVLTAITGATSIALSVPVEGVIETGGASLTLGASFSTEASPTKVAASRVLQAAITGTATAGKVKWFVRYVQSI